MNPNNEPRARSLTFDKTGIDIEARTVPLSVSSDSPDVLTLLRGRRAGYEILDHSSMSSIDLSRFKGDNGGPLLFNHDRSVIIGRFMPTEVVDGKLRGVARFGRSAKADEAFRDVQDGILTDTSIYFDYDEDDAVLDPASARHDDFPTFRVRHWSLMEASMVPLPADPRVGVGRSAVVAPQITAISDQEAPITDAPDAAIRSCEADGCTPDTPCPECRARCSAETPRSLAVEPATPATTPQAAPSARSKEIHMDPITGAAPDAANEITQVLQLRAIADQHGKGREADEIFAAKPLAEARALVMSLLATTPIAHAPSVEEMGANKRELKDFSYSRLLSASVAMQEGRRSANCFELEVSEEIKKSMPGTYKQRGGVFVPYQLRAAMDTQTATAGKELVYTQPAELIEILRNKLVVAQMGARFLTGLQGPMGFSRQTGAAVAKWIAENSGTDVVETEPTTGISTLSPRTLIGGTQFSRNLLETGTWSVENMVRQDLAYSHAAALDLAALHGTGVGQPTGIYALAGVNVVPMLAASPTYAELLTMIVDIAGANATLDGMGWITNPIVAGNLMGKLEFAVNGANKIWSGNVEEGVMAGYKALSTNQIAKNLGAGTNEHGLIIGSWPQVIVGCFGSGFEMITDPFKYKLQGLIDIATFEMADVLVRHPEAFTKATGLIPT